MSNELEMLERASRLMVKFSDDERHPIVVDSNDDIACLMAIGRLFAINNDINEFRIICEVLFFLGYKAGQQHEDIPDGWHE